MMREAAPTETGVSEIVSDDFPTVRHVPCDGDEEWRVTESANAVVSAAATNVCCEQPIYGDGVGVAIALKPNVVAGVGLGFSSGVGVGIASDFGLPLCPAPTECCARDAAPWAP